MRFISARIAVTAWHRRRRVKAYHRSPRRHGRWHAHYKTSRTSQKIVCDSRPISLDGDRTELTRVGPCHFVRISGSHNDIALDIIPAGTIEITGAHNDVSWRLTEAGSPS